MGYTREAISAGDKSYRCRVKATNAAGTGSYGNYGTTQQLPAPETPPGPTITSSTPSAGAITVAFTPQGDGGSPITDYSVICRAPQGYTGFGTGTQSPITVDGLYNGHTYRCAVRAYNARGFGPAGPESEPVLVGPVR